MVGGRRVTDEATLEVSTMVLNGSVNTRIVAACRSLSIPAVGLSGVDAGLISAKKRPATKAADGSAIEWGQVGDITAIQTDVLKTLLSMPAVPVISPLCADDEGTVLNVNADTVASRLAVALGAEKLIFMSNPRGILEDPANAASLVSYTDLAGLAKLEERGSLKDGMLPKSAAIRGAIEGGVPRVHVISCNVANSLLIEIFTNEGSGTLIVRETAQLRTEEKVAAEHGA
jgi:acetylglutamate kinase